MFEESLPSIWASMSSWFTPGILFLLMNLMIGTIAVTSGFVTQKKQPKEGEAKQTQVARAPSVLERVKSINFYQNRSEEPNPSTFITTTVQHPGPATQQAPELAQDETLDQNPDHVHEYEFTRTASEASHMRVKRPEKIKRSSSSESVFGRFEEEKMIDLDLRRPSTMREGKSEASELQHFGEDEEVDAKADDFISKFRQDLKLQRVDSLKRLKEMVKGGA